MRCQPRFPFMVDRLRPHVHRLLCPSTCLVCGGVGRSWDTDLCEGCERDFARLESACERCANPLAAGATHLICGRCLRRPPRFDSSFCPFRYRAPVDELIRRLKYRNGLACARLLGQLFGQSMLHSRRALPECIVPVPSSSARFRERGFNQALELGRIIARCTHVPLATDVLARTRHTAEQAGLKPIARRRNVRNAFAVCRSIRARHVAILDDVMTTGSTVNEIARVLRKAGVEQIEVWAIARAGVTKD